MPSYRPESLRYGLSAKMNEAPYFAVILCWNRIMIMDFEVIILSDYSGAPELIQHSILLIVAVANLLLPCGIGTQVCLIEHNPFPLTKLFFTAVNVFRASPPALEFAV